MPVFTIGHSTRTLDELIGLLKRNGVDFLVDVRRFPRSRTNPQFNADVLPSALEAAGIAYLHAKPLGGRRGKAAEHSRNTAWRSEGFRNYADYAATPTFREALSELERQALHHTPAIMCAEAVWWRCHRRIIADYLLIDGIDVRHILGDQLPEPAKLTPDARLEPDGALVYSADPTGDLFALVETP